jgi:type II secretory pathway component GspD/PulD (secretin)
VAVAPGQTPQQKAAAKLAVSLTVPTPSDPAVHMQVILAEVDWCAHVEPGILALFDRSQAGSFVFIRSSDAVDAIIRALQRQGRCDILSRNNTTTSDRVPSQIKVGQDLDFLIHPPTTTITRMGPSREDQDTRSTGGILTVTPNTTGNGHLSIQLIADLYSVFIPYIHEKYVIPKNIPVQRLQAKACIADGETIVLAGKINEMRVPTHWPIPFLSDLPDVGDIFRVRTHSTSRTQPVLIVTPHIVPNRSDSEISSGRGNDGEDLCD